MLRGEYFHQIDAKGRVRIPPKFKDALGQAVITRGTNGCLFIFSETEFRKQIEPRAYSTDLFDEVGNRQLRILASSAFELEIDDQGRSLLPKTLRDAIKIEKDVVFVGVINRVELWTKEDWERYLAG